MFANRNHLVAMMPQSSELTKSSAIHAIPVRLKKYLRARLMLPKLGLGSSMEIPGTEHKKSWFRPCSATQCRQGRTGGSSRALAIMMAVLSHNEVLSTGP